MTSILLQPFHKCTTMGHLSVKTSAELVQYALKHGMLKKGA